MNLLQEVARNHANQKPKEDVSVLRRRERELVAECDLLAECKANLLEVEENSRKEIASRLAEVGTELAEVRFDCFLSESGYPILDPEPFRMRDEKGLPKLALFSVDSSTCQFYCSNSYGHYFSAPPLPKSYRDVYKDVGRTMAATLAERFEKVKQQFRFALWGATFSMLSLWLLLSRPGFVYNIPAIAGIVLGALSFFYYGMRNLNPRFEGLTLTHRVEFSGIIPKEKRQKIGMLMKRTAGPGKVFLLAEVGEWGKTIKTDPLVLVSDDTHFYVADSFDTTTLEGYVAREFVRDSCASGS